MYFVKFVNLQKWPASLCRLLSKIKFIHPSFEPNSFIDVVLLLLASANLVRALRRSQLGLASHLSVVRFRNAKELVHLFQTDTLGFGDKEEDKETHKEAEATKHEKHSESSCAHGALHSEDGCTTISNETQHTSGFKHNETYSERRQS